MLMGHVDMMNLWHRDVPRAICEYWDRLFGCRIAVKVSVDASA